MAYCTKSDLLLVMSNDLLVAMTDTEGEDVVNEDVLARAISDSDAEINYYLAGLFDIPLFPVPDIVRSFSVNITVYKLSITSSGGAKEDQKMRYEQIIKKLQDISAGRIRLIAIDQSGSLTSATSSNVRYYSRTRIFTESTLLGY